jgi:hypothetical protein
MNNVLVGQIFRGRHGRWLSVGCVMAVLLGLGTIYMLANRARIPDWPKNANFNWARSLDLTYSAAKPENAFTVTDISYINGKLSASCAYRNTDPNRATLVHGVVDVYGGFWTPVRLEATSELPPRWKAIGKSPNISGKSETKTVVPGDVIAVDVDLDPYRALIRKYRYARLVTETGASGLFELKALLPPCENWPPGRDCLPTAPSPEFFPLSQLKLDPRGKIRSRKVNITSK